MDAPEPCPRCGGELHAATVKTAIWRDSRVFVVEDIPAQLCSGCMEQFYDEETTDILRRLTEEGFASLDPIREVLVPVYSLHGRIPLREPNEDEIPADY